MTNQSLLDKLNFLFNNRDRYFQYEGLEVTFHKEDAATEQYIAQLVKDRGFNIPTDYIEFLRVFNGCTLFKYQDLGGFELLGTKDIAKNTTLHQSTYEEEWDLGLSCFVH
jgi:hypothetical protein